MTTNMFESIKDAMANTAQQNTTSNIMRLKPGNTYTLRLIPFVEDPSKTFFHYYSHGWVSEMTGQFQSSISPQTWGERDPIAEARYRLSRTGSEEEKEKAKALNRKENWLVNVYVVKDPDNPENEGKVKILRFGRQLHKIVMEAIEGEDAEEFGERIFDLSKDGCGFRVKVEEQGGYPTYVSSRFAAPSKINGVTNDNVKEIYEQVFDLENVFPVKSYEELQTMLNEHYHGITEDSVAETTQKPTTNTPDEEDDLPFDDLEPSSKKDSSAPVDDDKVKELLDSLD
tara:strand:- start:75 stop:929 length:855 start_codon:yes stop_codon:yes gene_type:complete